RTLGCRAMTTPPDDDSRPDASPSRPPRSDARRVRAAAPDAAAGPEGAASPIPPQAWFTPAPTPAPEPPPTAPTPTPAKSLGEYVDVMLIAAAALLLLSIFLPWTTWSTPDLGRSVLQSITPQQSHLSYGMSGAQGEIVLFAGMAALSLAL